MTRTERDIKELTELLERIKSEKWDSPNTKRSVLTGIIMAMGTLRSAHMEEVRAGAEAHPMQEYNENGSACHHPACSIWHPHVRK